jgi:putative endopeptidase
MRFPAPRLLAILACLVLPPSIAAQALGSFCRIGRDPSNTSGAARGAQAPAKADHGWDPAGMDASVSPCVNFFHYAAGGWLKKNPIPASYSSWGLSEKMESDNQQVLRGILEQAAARRNAPHGSVDQKIGDFYASCMNTSAIEAAGAKPLAPELERIAEIHSLAGLEAEAARLQAMGVNVLFRFRSEQDDKNSAEMIAVAGQGGLGLPDRDYYTKTDAHSAKLRREYRQHVARMFELLGDAPATAQKEAGTVMAIETRLAKVSMTRLEQRNPNAVYHKMPLRQLQALTPEFSWNTFFSEVGFPRIDAVNVRQPKFFAGLDAELKTVPPAEWKTYLRWHLAHTAAPALSSKFVSENFRFYGQALTGAKQLQPRWKRCVQSTNRHLGFALGRDYVAKRFPPEAKARAYKMVEDLVAALREDIKTLPWMGPETKRAALDKLSHLTIKVGYPDKWRSYSAFEVTRGAYVGNLIRGEQYEFHRDLAKIGKPVDRTEWDMTPPTVNAYYDPTMNEIVFPAGILQPPFFDPEADDALNYGGIGAAIGHEMTHGFDDEGRQYDAQGNLKNWWTESDLKNFQARAECVANQFDGYIAVDNLHENGHLELGESIADLGGLVVAYKAFQTTPEARSGKKIGGFTPDQRFFLAYARSWEEQTRPAAIRLRVSVDPHPLAIYRTNGPVANMPEFAAAFACREGQPEVRPKAKVCRIW